MLSEALQTDMCEMAFSPLLASRLAVVAIADGLVIGGSALLALAVSLVLDPDSQTVYVNKVGTFGVSFASYWWTRTSAAGIRATHHLLAPGPPAIRGRPGLLATLIGVKLWVPESSENRVLRVAIRATLITSRMSPCYGSS